MTNTKQKFLGYIGTYTKGASEGIYSFVLDTDARALIGINCAAKIENPTYLTISSNNQYLYSVAKEGDLGGVAAFSILKNGALHELNRDLLEGSPPCHVNLDSNAQTLLSANYHKGTVELYRVDKGGNIQSRSFTVKHEGQGPDPRQEKAHTHFAGYTPDEKFVVAVDLGIDQLITYEPKNDILIEISRFNCRSGSGPRHLVFHPREPFAYIMTEFSSEVIVLKYSEDDGNFSHVQTISTLPADFTDNNQGSAIHISGDGKFIYAANRGHDSLAVFQVDPKTFELSFVEHTSTEGSWPRDFVLDPTEKFLIASNQNSSNLVLYSRDTTTGTLTLIQSDITVPDPVCVKFLKEID